MEIIASIVYNQKNHSTIEFIKKYFARMAVSMMKYEAVHASISHRSIGDSMRTLLDTKWEYTKMVGSMVAGQCHQIELVDDAWVHIYLLENASKDKFVMYMSGQHKEVLTIDLGFVGNPKTFKKYIDELTISEFEVYSDVSHLIED